MINAFVTLAEGVSNRLDDPEKTLRRNTYMFRFISMLPIVMLSVSCSFFGIRSGLEHSNYEVVEVISRDLEIRRYSSRVAIETTVKSEDFDKARRRAFSRLFNYISGANETGGRIAITAPVERVSGAGAPGAKIAMTAPVETVAYNDQTLMRFFLPSKMSTETIPVPTDPQVSLVTVPEQILAARRFAGRASERDLATQKERLTADLTSSHWEAQGAVRTFFYDPPWTLPFLRRNEVVVVVHGGKE